MAKTKIPTRSRTTYRKRSLAQKMRGRPSKPEAVLWEFLRRSQLGARFTRQRPCLGWILDFYCADTLLAIEVDGPFHDRRKDAHRDRVLRQRAGITTLRFPAAIVLATPDRVAARIRWHLQKHGGKTAPKIAATTPKRGNLRTPP